MSVNSLHGRRILALGAALAPHAKGPLAGADLELGGIDQLAELASVPRDLVLIDADAWAAPELAAAVKTLSGLKACPPVLLVGESLPAGLVRNLLRLGDSDVLEAPFTGEQLTAAVLGLLAASTPAPQASAGGESRCWAVSGAVGGAGATTLAIEIATALAARSKKDRSVCLIDLNLADGAAAAYLGAQPAMRLADFGQAAERLDAAMLQAFITPVSKQLDLLAGVRDPGGFDAVSREAVLRVLEVACECYDWVILDVPRHRRPWTLEALAGCDEVLVISELTVPALLAARAYSDEIEHALGKGLKPRIVLNRLASRMFGPAPSMAEAERALQRKAEAGVSSDWEAAAASANLGGPIAQHRPKSKIVKDVQLLVERLAEAPARQGAKAA
ncbi:Flp pilus assembly protein, ATPase [Phenylobacterium zucineum HLK1]|uniref:Flp pilus assembly protein, ATPase n=1 Tax=Phenylobacterium zucineum (strain HLK1) TaxID=450851 RepID=B4R9H8_PHEZH|nr:cellulose synthase operon protein YhjQ/BcsQ [Phenylobacterium zucineum]ACG79438.1 Flp pilus assembly protein, ATPase [Phenylobacterium zucineum HLK1]